MKKIFLFVAMFLMASTLCYAQEWVGVDRNTPVEIQELLVSSSEDEIVVDVKVGGFYKQTVETPKGKQLVISADKMAAMLTEGAPELPMYPISMIIGDRAEMEVSILKSNYTDFENIEVAPSKGNFSRQINPADVEYVYGEMYEQDAFYPATQASLDKPYILRDFRAQNLMIYPYTYNPVTKTLRVYTELRIAVKKVSDNGENQKVTRRGSEIKLNMETRAAYERRFINFNNQSKYDYIVDEGEMLVICVDSYMNVVQPLVNWKNISGRPTKMVGTSETGTGNSMKNYIQNYYYQNPNFRYLLLVGEYNNLPPYTMSYSIKSDNYYGMLEGNDYYEEVLVGRLSVNSVQDATNQVNKILHYEKDINETATWLSRAVGIAANEGSGHNGEPDYVHMNYIRDTLMHYTITEMSKHYAYVNNPTASNIVADFNAGASVANYCNHGSYNGWSVASFKSSHVHQLINDQKLPIIWSVACNNGQFDYQECFAEAWMRATNNTTDEPTGAIGGMFSWISQPWQPPMYGQDEMNAILTEWHSGYRHTLGGASVNGNMFVLDMCPYDYGETHNSWILFGDPSMMVRTKAPESMNVVAEPSELTVGMSSLNVNADTDFGIATLSKDGEVIASAYVENGVAQLNFSALSETGELQLVVIGYNRVTEIFDIEVNQVEDSNYWTPDANLYANNMTVIGVLEIDGVEQNGTNWEIGAFCGDEVRGSAKAQYIPSPVNRYEYFLMVYGEAGDEITFRLYDHNTGLESDMMSNNVESFVVNGATGDIMNPYIISFASDITQSYSLQSGWNWYSTYIEVEGSEGLEMMQEGLGDDAIQIKSHSSGFVNYEAGIWFGGLTEIKNEEMYMIKMSSSHVLEMTGSYGDPSAHPITLGTNWKWIGYPVDATMSVSEALSNLSPNNGDYVKSQFHFAQYYEGLGWTGTLGVMEPGRGYMYQNTSGTVKTLVYPTPSSKGTMVSNVTTENNRWDADGREYPTNMTVIAVVEGAGTEYEVAAFSGGECRGSARPIYVEQLDSYMIFMTVYGEDGDEITFRYYDVITGEEQAIEEGMIFGTDATFGDVMNPYVMMMSPISIGECTIETLSIYPNPVGEREEIRLGGEYDVVEVYNSIGMKVAEYKNVSKIDGLETSGVYVVRIMEGDKVAYDRIVVE